MAQVAIKYDAMRRYTIAAVSMRLTETSRAALTSNVAAGDNHETEDAHGLEKVVGAHDPLEAKAGGVLARHAGRRADRRLVQVRVEVEKLVDLESEISYRKLLSRLTTMKVAQK